MLNAHSKVGVATIAFYAPAAPLAAYLLLRRHGRPHQPWVLLYIFSLVRIASGIVAVIYENNANSIGLLIAAIILLGVGVMPLIAAILGFIRLVLSLDLKDTRVLHKAVMLARILFLIGVALLVAGGIYVGNYKSPSDVQLGAKLVKAGYSVVVVTLAYLLGFVVYLWTQRNRLSSNSMIVLKGVLLSMILIAIRIIYAMLSICNTSDPKWNNLNGSVGIFVGMALLPEYFAIIIFIGVGFTITPVGKEKNKAERVADRHDEASEEAGESDQGDQGFVERLYKLWSGRD